MITNDDVVLVPTREWTHVHFDEAAFWVCFYERTFAPCLETRVEWPEPAWAFMYYDLEFKVVRYRKRIDSITKAILEERQ